MTAEELVVRASLKDELSRPVRALRRGVRDLSNEVERADSHGNRFTRTLGSMASGAGRLAKIAGRTLVTGLKATAIGIAGVTTAAVLGGAKLVGLAMDAAETGSAFRTVFKGVSGDVSGYIDRMNAKFGITTAELQAAATTFGVFGKAAGVSRADLGGFTKDLVGAGLDLASFYNAEPGDVFQDLRSGLAGEAEPLRKFGIFLSESMMKSEAAALGLKGELSESQKVMVRQRIIMKSLGDAGGDLDRTSGGLANQWRRLKGILKEGATVIGTALLPVVTPLVKQLADRAGPAVERLAEKVPALSARVGAFAGDVADAYREVKWFVDLFRAGGWSSGVAALDGMVGAGGRLTDAFEYAGGIVEDLRDVLVNGLLPGIQDVTSAIDPAWLTPLGLARSLLGYLADNAGLVRVMVVALTAAYVANTAATLISNTVHGIASVLLVARIGTTALLTGAIGTNTVAELTRNQAIAMSIGLHARLLGALVVSIARTIAHTVATVASTAAMWVARTAIMAWVVAQWALNVALSANPIGLVVIGIALLIGGFILLYRRSETVRTAVAWLWDNLKRFAKFTPLGLLIQAFVKLKGIVEDVVGWLGKLKFPKAPGWVGKLIPGGDTATSRARGTGGGLDRTLAMHSQLAPRGVKVTNALVGGGGSGRGSGDHQRGRALDLVGPGLGSYKRNLERAGGYGAFHGDGQARHLHAVYPAGDASTSRRTRTGGTRTEAPVIVQITVQGNASEVDRRELKRAVRDGIREAERDRLERAGG